MINLLAGVPAKNRKGSLIMSVQLAKDEKVIRSFTYAALGYNKKKNKYDTFKSLIVTNKRLIHEAVRETRNNELILRQEMPVADAKYIKTVMGKSCSPQLLVQAIIYAVIAVMVALLATFDFAEKFFVVFLVLAAPFLFVAIKKLVDYFASFSNIVSFSIFTDHPVTPVLTTAAVEVNNENADGAPRKAKNEPSLEIRVNSDVARQIADGLGAAILNAVTYNGEDIELEENVTVEPLESTDEPIDAEEAVEETETETEEND